MYPLLLDWAPAPATLLCLLTVHLLLTRACLIFVLFLRIGAYALPSTVYASVTPLLSNFCINTAATLHLGYLPITHWGVFPVHGKSPVKLFSSPKYAVITQQLVIQIISYLLTFRFFIITLLFFYICKQPLILILNKLLVIIIKVFPLGMAMFLFFFFFNPHFFYPHNCKKKN